LETREKIGGGKRYEKGKYQWGTPGKGQNDGRR